MSQSLNMFIILRIYDGFNKNNENYGDQDKMAEVVTSCQVGNNLATDYQALLCIT